MSTDDVLSIILSCNPLPVSPQLVHKVRGEGKFVLFALYSPCTLRTMPHLKEGPHKLGLNKLPSSGHSVNPPKDQLSCYPLLALDIVNNTAPDPGTDEVHLAEYGDSFLRVSQAWEGNYRNILPTLYPDALKSLLERESCWSHSLFPLSESEAWL